MRQDDSGVEMAHRSIKFFVSRVFSALDYCENDDPGLYAFSHRCDTVPEAAM
jgi:hypothetical protein